MRSNRISSASLAHRSPPAHTKGSARTDQTAPQGQRVSIERAKRRRARLPLLDGRRSERPLPLVHEPRSLRDLSIPRRAVSEVPCRHPSYALRGRLSISCLWPRGSAISSGGMRRWREDSESPLRVEASPTGRAPAGDGSISTSSAISRSDHTWSATPAAIAGVVG